MSWYKAGKIAVTNGKREITGTGTDFVNNVKSGFAFLGPDLSVYEIDAVTSATSATLAVAYRGATVANSDYGIFQTQGILAALSAQVADLIVTFGPLRTALPDMILYVQQAVAAQNAALVSADRAGASEIAAGSSAASALDSKNSSAQSAATASQQATSAVQSASNAASSAAAATGAAAAIGFGQNVATTAALIFGYFGGNVRQDNNVVAVPDGTIALTASAVWYVSVQADGKVVRNLAAYASGTFPIARVSTGATAINSVTDTRAAATIAPLAGFRNKIINGDMRIDQRNRGNAQTIPVNAVTYTLDRFWAYATGAAVTGQQIFDTSVSPNRYAYQITGAAGNTAVQYSQRIESQNVFKLCGSNVVFGVDMANSLLTTVTWALGYPTAVDNFTTVIPIASGTFTLTPAVTRFSASALIPQAASTGLQLAFTVTNQTSGTWKIGEVSLEPGTILSAPEFRHIQTEQQLCYRYYRRWRETTYNCCGGSQSIAAILPVSVPFRVAATMSTNMSPGNYASSAPGANQWSMVAGGVQYITNGGSGQVSTAGGVDIAQFLTWYSPGFSAVPNQLSLGPNMYIDAQAELY
ncbi:hypothetical protein ACIPF8_18920 [Collimonas sp. NPDC087041]|uniref:hypothetical protein n=1 Tax=Collimonas sp. NPDC087041 TaxID=3363960 RepID=UPI0038011CCE